MGIWITVANAFLTESQRAELQLLASSEERQNVEKLRARESELSRFALANSLPVTAVYAFLLSAGDSPGT